MLRVLPRYFLLFVLWTGSFAHGNAESLIGPALPSGDSFTLEQCLNRALERNPRILVARQQIEQSKGVIITAKASLYPHISSSGQIEYRNLDILEQDNNPQNNNLGDFWAVEIRVTQSLYSGGINRETIAIAKLRNDSDFIDLQTTIDQVMLEVKRTYYDVLLNRSEINVQRQNIGLLQAELERQRNLFSAGRSTRFNIVRIEVNLANSKPELLRVQNELKLAEINLSELLAMPWEPRANKASIVVSGTLDGPPVDVTEESLILLARARRPELRKAQNQISISESQIRIARASNIPKVDAFVGARAEQGDTSQSDFFASRSDFSVGLLGRWDIFDGFAGKGRAISGEAQLNQAKLNQGALQLAIDAEVRRAFARLELARKTVKSQSENVGRADKSLELARLSAETGFATVLDVLQATVDVSNTRNIENRAKYRYLTSLAELERAVSVGMKDWSSPTAMGEKPPAVQGPIKPAVQAAPRP